MEKIKNFLKPKNLLKWPAFIVSTLAFVAFLITAIVTCTRAFSYGTYVYEGSKNGEVYKIEIELDDEYECEVKETYVSDLNLDISEKECYYRVHEGKLYMTDSKLSTELKYFGEITPFEIIINTNKATNKGAEALYICSIVFTGVFGIGALISLAYILTGKKKKDVKTNIKTEEVSETVSE